MAKKLSEILKKSADYQQITLNEYIQSIENSIRLNDGMINTYRDSNGNIILYEHPFINEQLVREDQLISVKLIRKKYDETLIKEVIDTDITYFINDVPGSIETDYIEPEIVQNLEQSINPSSEIPTNYIILPDTNAGFISNTPLKVDINSMVHYDERFINSTNNFRIKWFIVDRDSDLIYESGSFNSSDVINVSDKDFYDKNLNFDFILSTDLPINFDGWYNNNQSDGKLINYEMISLEKAVRFQLNKRHVTGNGEIDDERNTYRIFAVSVDSIAQYNEQQNYLPPITKTHIFSDNDYQEYSDSTLEINIFEAVYNQENGDIGIIPSGEFGKKLHIDWWLVDSLTDEIYDSGSNENNEYDQIPLAIFNKSVNEYKENGIDFVIRFNQIPLNFNGWHYENRKSAEYEYERFDENLITRVRLQKRKNRNDDSDIYANSYNILMVTNSYPKYDYDEIMFNFKSNLNNEIGSTINIPYIFSEDGVSTNNITLYSAENNVFIKHYGSKSNDINVIIPTIHYENVNTGYVLDKIQRIIPKIEFVASSINSLINVNVVKTDIVEKEFEYSYSNLPEYPFRPVVLDELISIDSPNYYNFIYYKSTDTVTYKFKIDRKLFGESGYSSAADTLDYQILNGDEILADNPNFQINYSENNVDYKSELVDYPLPNRTINMEFNKQINANQISIINGFEQNFTYTDPIFEVSSSNGTYTYSGSESLAFSDIISGSAKYETVYINARYFPITEKKEIPISVVNASTNSPSYRDRNILFITQYYDDYAYGNVNDPSIVTPSAAYDLTTNSNRLYIECVLNDGGYTSDTHPVHFKIKMKDGTVYSTYDNILDTYSSLEFIINVSEIDNIKIYNYANTSRNNNNPPPIF